MSNCPFCKVGYKQNAIYCHGCGRKIVEYRYCGNKDCRRYNKVLPNDEAYCALCGVQATAEYAGAGKKGNWLALVIILVLLGIAFIYVNEKPESNNVSGSNNLSAETVSAFAEPVINICGRPILTFTFYQTCPNP